ncbi:MAG: glycosyltransferase family 4 protein [Candidatus Ranarchaeia archaeon]
MVKKIGILDTTTNYVKQLIDGIQENKDSGIKLLFYAKKNERKDWMPHPKNVWSSMLYPLQVFQACAKDHLDILHIQFEFGTFGSFFTTLLYPFLLVLLKLLPTKVITTFHASITLEDVSEEFVDQLIPFKSINLVIQLKLFFIILYKSVSTFTDKLLIHSKLFRDRMVKTYNFTENKVIHIPIGISSKARIYSRKLLEKWESKIGNKRIILFFGTIAPRKGLEYLIPAFKDILKKKAEFVLVIAGAFVNRYESYLQEIRNIIEDLDLTDDVILTGGLPMKYVHTFLEAAEVVIFPYTYSISASGPLVFAIEHKKPIIASGINFFKEELKNGKAGLLIPIKDKNAIYNSLLRLTTDKELQNKYKKELEKMIKTQSLKEVGRKHIEIYKSM